MEQKKMRKAIKAQLQYIQRDLKHIEELAQQSGLHLIEHISWDNFHEGNTLQASVEAYRAHFGCYPE